MQKYYNVSEVAEELGLHPETVRRFLLSGEIPGNRFGKQWRVSRAQLDEYIRRTSNQKDPVARLKELGVRSGGFTDIAK